MFKNSFFLFLCHILFKAAAFSSILLLHTPTSSLSLTFSYTHTHSLTHTHTFSHTRSNTLSLFLALQLLLLVAFFVAEKRLIFHFCSEFFFRRKSGKTSRRFKMQIQIWDRFGRNLWICYSTTAIDISMLETWISHPTAYYGVEKHLRSRSAITVCLKYIHNRSPCSLLLKNIITIFCWLFFL